MAEVRNVSALLSVKVNQFKADMAAAGKAAVDAASKTETAWDKSTTGAGKAMKAAQQYSQEMTTVGTGLATFGGVVVGSLGLATKAAMSWESAWTGVLKTVDGTPKQLAAIESGLRGLAKTLPASHEEIAAVAEAAGQLGVQTDAVVTFTKTMIDMGESTNLSADEAATSLAQFMNIMGTSQKDVNKLGAAIVGLGNNGASTEKDIVDMAMRLAGAGKQANMTEGDVLGMANAMASVGIESEAGGTAMSMVMKRMGNAVMDGGAQLESFARVAGMSSSEFAAAWNADSGGALNSFVVGLGNAQESGENVNKTLSDLGITGIRESDALLRLSASGDILADSLKMGNDEFERGTALAQEAAKRYETAESKIKIAGNSLKDTAITIGGTFLPAIADGADAFAGFADSIGKLPEPVLKVTSALGGIVGASALAGGAALILVPKIAETVTAVKALQTAAAASTGTLGKFSGALAAIGPAAAGAAIGLTAFAVSKKLADSGLGDLESTQEAVTQLAQLRSEGGLTADALDEMFTATGNAVFGVNGFGDALKKSDTNGFKEGLAELVTGFGLFADTTSDVAIQQLEQFDSVLAATAQSGDPELLAQSFQTMVESADEFGYSAEDIIEKMPELKAQLVATAAEWGVSADNATLAKIALGEITGPAGEAAGAVDGVGSSAQDAAKGLQEMLDGLLALGLATLSERDAMRQYESAVDGVTESIKENGTSLDITTEKGRNNQEAFDAIADAGMRAADSMAENGESQKDVQNQLQRTYDDLIDAAGQFGITGKKAEDMAKEVMGIPKDVDIKTWMSDAAQKQAIDLKKELEKLDGKTVQTFIKVNETYIRKEQGEATYTKDRYGNAPKARYHGGIDLMPMAQGGMLSKVAQMVPPNTWRLVGDRMDVDEAFVPLDGSRRSWEILMQAMRRMPGAIPMAKGGIASAEKSVDAAQDRLKAARRAKSDAKSKTAKSQAERRIRVAEDELNSAKKSLKAAKEKQKADEKAAKIAADRAKEERERKARVNDLRTDLRVDLRRGNIRDQVTGGLSGGYSAVDRLFDLGSNQDLSRGSRSRANTSARKFEANLKSLYAQAERIDNRLKKAQDKATELKGIKDSVTSSLLGGRDLDVGTTSTMVNGQWQTSSNLGQAAKGLRMDVGAMKAFAGKLKKLVELGIPGAIVQEIAQAGVAEGSNMADSFIDATAAERKSYLGAWSDYEKYANQAGQYVTEGFYKGGSAAADGVVKGLEGKQKNVEKAIANLAKAMESTFKQVLGIHSPSRVMSELGGFTAEGLVQGMLSGVGDVQSAAAALGSAAVPNMMAFAPSDMSMDVGVSPVVSDDEGMAGLAMQDMSNTTLEAMQAMGLAVSDGFAGMLANTQTMQAGMLLATQESNLGQLTDTQTQQAAMLLNTQTQNANMLSDTQTKQEEMRSTVQSKQTAQKTVATEQQEAMRLMLADKQSQMKTRSAEDFEALKNTTHSKFATMRSETDTTMSNTHKDYSGRLGELKGLNQRGFESILKTSNKNMEAVRDGIDGEMAAAKPEMGNRLNALIGVLSKFTASVNKAFGDVGVKLKAPQALNFATGGVLPGYTPGRDVHEFYSPTAGYLNLSGGEAIMRPEFVRAVGGRKGIDELNRQASGGHLQHETDHFATGGVIPKFSFANGGTLIDAANWWVRKGARGSRHPAFGGAVRSGHSRNSLHYQDRAVDLNYGPGGTNAIEQAFFDKWIGQFKGAFPGIRTIWRAPGHFNHLHIDTGNGADIGNFAGALAAGEMSHPFLDRAKVSASGNLTKAYAQAAKKLTSQIYAKHAKDLPDGLAGQLGRGIMSNASEGLIAKAKEYGKTTAVSGSTAGDPAVKAAVRKVAEQMGWDKYWGDIDWLVNKESSWNPKAANPSSSARGLFQKMTSLHGPVEDTVEGQARWGLNYIKNAYGNPAKARAFHQSHNWYEGGTERAKRGLAVVGEDGPELVNFQGGEQVLSTADSMKFMAANRTYIPNTGGAQFDQAAFTNAVAGAVQANGINPNDLADALSNMRITFNADGQQFTGAVTAVIGSGYDQSRSRLSKSSQKIGAR